MRRIGRFELRSTLGRGAQATVWLAFDARLRREVALKLLEQDAAEDPNEALHEARAVGRINHPNIVPVYEADVSDGQAYLVFEYVSGPTLSQLVRQRGALPAREAVELMVGVTDALVAAHAAGIVHRDLKPSNVLVDSSGRARVMDFGIAAALADQSDRRIVGTPGYMSPQAVQGEPPSPSMDIFAAGMLLAELLLGSPLIRERDPHRAIERTLGEDLSIPLDGPQVDDALRTIIMRCITRDAVQRIATATELRDQLRKWLEPQGQGEAAPAGNGTLEFLLRRMRQKSDFPTLSDSVVRIQRVASSETGSVGNLADEILKDVALTNKLLRLVNAASYRHAGGGTISTVSRAVALVGFAGVRNMALALVLLEHMQDKGHATMLREEFLRSLLAGNLAAELCPTPRDAEEAFVGALFQNLGRMLTQFYFGPEAQEIRDLTPTLGETPAAIRVLGLDYATLGIAVARSWGLPASLQRCMSRPDDDPPDRPIERGPEQLRHLATLSNDVADALLQCEPKAAAERIESLAQRHARALGLSAKDVQGAVERSRSRVSEAVRVLDIALAPGSPARRLLTQTAAAGAAEPDSLARHVLRPTDIEDARTIVSPRGETAAPASAAVGATPGSSSRADAADMLAAGVADITSTLASDSFRLDEVLRMILETLLRALGLRSVVFCLRDPRTHSLVGRYGLGQGAADIAKAFNVPLKVPAGQSADLFTAVCLKGADTLITDAHAQNIAARLPAWYAAKVNAGAFVLLPLSLKGAPVALIYADMAKPGTLMVGEKELTLLRTLRNQAVMAFKQAG